MQLHLYESGAQISFLENSAYALYIQVPGIQVPVIQEGFSGL